MLIVMDPVNLETDKTSLLYNKICKMKLLVDECRRKFQSSYNLGRMGVMDEMILQYKDKFCSIM